MIVDGIVLIVLLISASIAFIRGFIREILTILGVVGGLAAAYFGSPFLVGPIAGMFGASEGADPEKLFGLISYTLVADAVAYGSVFIVVVIGLSVLSHYLAEAAQNVGLGAIDRTLGVLFGLLRGVLLLGLLFMPVHLFVEKDMLDKWMGDSKSHYYLEETASVMVKLLPENALEKVQESAEDVAEKSEGLGSKIDVLKAARDGKEIDINKLKGSAEEKLKNKDSSGYNENFRNEMDRLFEEETIDQGKE